MPEVLYLIDGHALAYRTYFALTGAGSTARRWATSSGEPTAGVFGFASVLLRILEQERPDYLAVAFDTGKTFRDDLFPEYKATREKMPDDLRIQIERIRQLVDAFNIPRLEVDGYEADDVLGSVSRKAADLGLGVKIITGDRDLLQLVDSRIIVNLPGGRSLSEAVDYTLEKVVEALNVRPDQVVDYKALVGDKSDNIPGVAGIGEKSAERLLQAYDNLDTIYENLADLKPGERKNLEAGRDDAYLSRKLARIVTDLDIPIDMEKARCGNFSPAEVEPIFRQLEFRALMQRLMAVAKIYGSVAGGDERQLALFGGIQVVPAKKDEAEAGVDIQAHIVQSAEELESLSSRLKDARVISFDTETTSTDQMRAELVGISLAVEEGEGFYIPVGHRTELGEQLPIDYVLDALRDPLTDPRIPKAGHNLKYDFIVLARYGLRASPLGFDTMIAEWLRNPDSRNLGLKNLAWVELEINMTDIEALIGKGKAQVTMAEVPIQAAGAYAAADAETVLRLMPRLQAELESRRASALLAEVEMPLIPVLAGMEMAGISIDTPFLSEMSHELELRMGEIEKEVYGAVGQEFNLNSPPQLSSALFDRLQLKPPDRVRRTATGFYSTSADVLEQIRVQHPAVDWVLEHRELSKLKSTYLDALPAQVNPATGRVHTSYNQTGSVTGRIASSNPNLQNIPIRTELGRKVRHGFVAAPGQVLLAVDYSQIELRIVADMAEDSAMIDAFRDGQDIHTTTAAAIYGEPIERVTRDQRRHAKAINFGLIYGMSPFGLTRTTDLTLAEAENFVAAYFDRFPGIKRYLDETRLLAARQGYVETLLGRRRYFPGLQNQTNYNVRNREEREAINAPIQGSAADIMKIAMIRVDHALADAGLQARMLLQVHDELVLECPAEALESTAQLVRRVMEDAYQLSVPLETDARQGNNWGEMSDVP
ncbi:MAG TPA: DNA polymerase I [Anaerolineales bacterium]|nr:DNA polymerase I [Anaerolineales bacterium]